MVLKKLTLSAIDDSVTYEEYLANCPGEGNSETNINYVQVVQGEDSTIRSESSLYAKYDKSAPNTQPYSVTNTILNYVGGETWCSAGQWFVCVFLVLLDGYYIITVKGRQNMPAAVYLPERYISMEKSHLKKWKRFPSNMRMTGTI